MRIKKIAVFGLFGVFDHTIPLNQEDRITIIHGPNGFGKTALLRMTQSLFSARLARLKRTPFREMLVEFDHNLKLKIRRQQAELLPEFSDDGSATLIFELFAGEELTESHELISAIGGDSAQRAKFESYIERGMHLGELERVSPEGWLHMPSGVVLTAEEVAEQYDDYFPPEIRLKSALPSWLLELTSCIPVRFIEAQRLLGFANDRRPRGYERSGRLEPAVNRCASEMASLIRDKQSEYGKKSQQLDSSFPARVLRPESRESVAVEEVVKNLESLEKQQQRIIAAGLLSTDDHRKSMIPGGDTGDETTRRILSLYVGDVEEKLSVFNSLTDKVETLQRVINERFSYKHLSVDARTGFCFMSSKKKSLQPTDLSSGEQHELVLFYELLFKTRENSLILIDEPELSLHVAWQVQFLKDISAVTKLSNFDVLLATHSPQIINDRWDLTVGLKGPGDATVSQP